MGDNGDMATKAKTKHAGGRPRVISGDTAIINVRVEAELWQRAGERAEQEGLDRASVIRAILEDYVTGRWVVTRTVTSGPASPTSATVTTRTRKSRK